MREQMPQLNSLRTAAVAMVMWYHWAPPKYYFGLDWGRMGVTLFFVLSGFLITGILLDGREDRIPTKQMLRRFYARRFLRIFPLFYAVTFLAALANAPGVRNAFWWHVTYTSNFYFFKLGDWSGPASHFWSLAVEEQFYIVWPLLMLLLPRRFLIPTMLGLIVVSTICRFLWQNVPLSYYVTPAVLDALALGAMLAYMKRNHTRLFNSRWVIFGSLLAGVILVATQIAPLFQSGCVLVSAGLIVAAANGATGLVGAILNFKPFQYLGIISYGLYVFHSFAPFVLYHLAGVPKLPLPLKLPAFGLFTIAVAAVSWHFFEKPLNDLKRYFPYKGAPATYQHAATLVQAGPGGV